MKILEELWHSINPQGLDLREDPRMKQALSLVVEYEDALRSGLSDIQKEQLEEVSDRQSELAELMEQKAFAKGFCLAMKIMMDIVNTMEMSSTDR